MKNIHAVALGKMGKGKPKNYSAKERALRRQRLAIARKGRWGKGAGAS